MLPRSLATVRTVGSWGKKTPTHLSTLHSSILRQRRPPLMPGSMYRSGGGGGSGSGGRLQPSSAGIGSSETDMLLGNSGSENTTDGNTETMVPVLYTAPSSAQSSGSLRPRSAAALQSRSESPELLDVPHFLECGGGGSSGGGSGGSSAAQQNAQRCKGLTVLFCTEAWERFSYYGMRALLVLYISEALGVTGRWTSVWGMPALAAAFGVKDDLLNGQSCPNTLNTGEDPCAREKAAQALASSLYGLYTAFVYLTPLFGGIIADRYMGQRSMILIGATLMAAGHALMALNEAAFLVALVLLILGNGAFKPNAAVQVGQLYAGDEHGRQWAYSVFYCGINLGAFLAPIVTGSVRAAVSSEITVCGSPDFDCAAKKEFDVRGFHAAFAVAGSAMALAMTIYIPGQKLLPPDTLADTPPPSKDGDGGTGPCNWNLDPYVKRLLMAITAIVSLASVFWAVYEQQGNTITTFADTQVNRKFLGWEMPTEYFQAVNPILIIALTPVINHGLGKLARRHAEPGPVYKMSFGLFLLALAYVVLSTFVILSGKHKTPAFAVFLYFIFLTAGELFVSPVGLALVNTIAPNGLKSLFTGLWYISSFAGNFAAGMLGSLYFKVPRSFFFFLMAIIAIADSAVFFLFANRLQNVVHHR